MIYLRKNHHLKIDFATNAIVIMEINHKVRKAYPNIYLNRSRWAL